MTPYEQFKREGEQEVHAMGEDHVLKAATRDWFNKANARKYSYHFEWLGRPIIQYPQDIVAMQAIIWRVQPELIIETGIAHGGSLIFSASMLELNASCGGPPDARVLGIDIDIRPHNREAIELHPMSRRITMIQGSSIDEAVAQQVREYARDRRRVLVCLDSNHTHAHVLAELKLYAPITTVGSYCVVFDTIIEDMPSALLSDRPWGVGNSPKTAVCEFLSNSSDFEIDKSIQDSLLITVAPGGYLRRVR